MYKDCILFVIPNFNTEPERMALPKSLTFCVSSITAKEALDLFHEAT